MKKKDPHAFVNQLLVCTLVAICVTGSVGLGAVWLRHQISVTANNTRRMQSQILELDRRLAAVHAQIEIERSPEALARRNVDMELGLVRPREAQVTRVSVSPERRLAAKRHSEAFAGEPMVTPVRFRLGGAGSR